MKKEARLVTPKPDAVPVTPVLQGSPVACSSLSRRAVVKAVAGAAGLAMGAPFVNLGRFALHARGPYSTRCIDLVAGSLVIDMLSPLAISRSVQERWGPGLWGMTEQEEQDFRDSEIDVFHIGVGIGGRDFDDQYHNTLLFVSRYNSLIAERPDLFVRVDSVEDLASVHGSGRAGILIGTQTSSHFRGPGDVNAFHALGQRVSQLTYNSRAGAGGDMDGVSGRWNGWVGVARAVPHQHRKARM